ncbi:peptidoglycan -binding protein [Sulfitobacter guttiformis]|uniref:Chemotaxis protein MotB n=1 Tax=Sulfitobacter guttiformis TaxID=74349 RepID=A0A420DQC5_9RHOB|nr:peptidoglycan -binding protein [Sulfitobacter guttiformis]KIN73727.1 Flagellar motor rotation protein MotB [Sulfitobacter guttiformis KCTC 32187]RKE96363.1 chemotaxis protein MotB [Sulfitobacter guttiformis]
MALSRRTGARFQASIWPGFVDAMTGLLLVLMFVLTIFMVVQFVLTEQISGQETELDTLSSEVAALAQALGLEQRTNSDLEARVGALRSSLGDAQTQAAQQASRIAALQSERDEQDTALNAAQTRLTSFEAQVAALIADRDTAQGQVAELTAREATLLNEQEALNLALAASRDEVDAQTEIARLAAARREALEAMAADLRTKNAAAEGEIERLASDAAAARTALSEREEAQLADAAAAEALRARLENADTELTAMTLSLEAQRKRAEETLTLLAAARAAQEELDLRLTATQNETEAEIDNLRAELAAAMAEKLAAQSNVDETQTEAARRAALLSQAELALSQEQETSAAAQRQTELLNQQVAALRAQLSTLQGLLDSAEADDIARQVELQSLGSQLNTALARVAVEERRRAELEAAEVERLQAETKNLEQYRSEFFGRLRSVLGSQEGVRIEGDRFVFSSEVLFPPGGADLSVAGQGEVAKVADILRNIAADIPEGIDWVIRVDGHTDNVPLSGQGEFADNWELSQARALSVVKYMANFLAIPPDRLAANGFGQYQPLDTANTEAARTRNRRIELKFTEK